MTTVVIVIHLMVVLAMIGLVLLQRSEGGALGIGGGQGAFMTGRSAGNVLTRTTAILAIAFFATSLSLALIAKFESRPSDILERLPGQTTPATTQTPAVPMTAPTSAEDLLKQLNATSGGPQTPPAPDATAPAANGTAAPAPAPAGTTPPAAQNAAPPAAQAPPASQTTPAPGTSPTPQTPPASGQ